MDDARVFKVVSYTKSGEFKTRLIEMPLEYELKDYFEPSCTEIKDEGIVQMVGSAGVLDSAYVSE